MESRVSQQVAFIRLIGFTLYLFNHFAIKITLLWIEPRITPMMSAFEAVTWIFSYHATYLQAVF